MRSGLVAGIHRRVVDREQQIGHDRRTDVDGGVHQVGTIHQRVKDVVTGMTP